MVVVTMVWKSGGYVCLYIQWFEALDAIYVCIYYGLAILVAKTQNCPNKPNKPDVLQTMEGPVPVQGPAAYSL